MLLTLNDDCLEYICQFLALSDQIAIACACQRLRDLLIERFWERTAQSVLLDSKTCEYFNKNKSIFKCFMCAISPKVKHLKVLGLRINNINALNGIVFPEIHSLYLNEQNEETPSYVAELQMLAGIFPTLKQLALKSPNINGQGLCELTTLEELELIDCKNLDLEQFSSIFSALKLCRLNLKTKLLNSNAFIPNIGNCNELEELAVSEDWFPIVGWHFRDLPLLHKIKIYSKAVGVFLAVVTEVFEFVIESVTFNNTFRSSKESMFCMSAMMALKRFILINDTISSEQFIYITMFNVENWLEVRLINSLKIDENNEGLFVFLMSCANLEILDISHNEIDINLLRDIITKLGTRRKPLLIHCFDTNVTKADLECLILPNLIKISMEEQKMCPPDDPYVQCEW